MNKLFYLLILTSLGISCSSSQSKDHIKNDTLKLPYKSNNKSLFWEISGNNLAAPSYIFGTIHIIPAADYFLGNNVEKAIENTNFFVTEIKLSSLMDVSLMSGMMLPKDTSLHDIMTDEEYEKVKAFYAKKMKIEPDNFDDMLANVSPIVIQQQISLAAFGEETKSYELELSKIAAKNDLENRGLETADVQMQVLASIPLKEQVSMLLYTIDSIDDANSELYKMIDLYKNQEVEGLHEFMKKSDFSKEFMNHKDAFLTNRNKSWIPIIDSLIQEKPSFIAVGAAHLYDNTTGVIQLLEKEGYTVKPLELN